MLMRRADRGGALLLVIVITILLVGFAGAYLSVTGASTQLTARDAMGLQAQYTAETGAAVVLSQINSGAFAFDVAGAGGPGPNNEWRPADMPAVLTGTVGNAAYNVTIALWGRDGVDNNGLNGIDDGAEQNVMTITAQGYVRGDSTAITDPALVTADPGAVVRQLEVILSRIGGSPFMNALYAGNSSNAAYTMTLKGGSTNSDVINGNTYVNGDLQVRGGADINGSTTISPGHSATDSSSQWDGSWANGSQPPLDLASMNYAANHDVDVAARLTTDGTSGGSSMGGTAERQITDTTNPASFFRLNPSDRKSVYTDNSTSNPGLSEHTDVYVLESPGASPGDGDPDWNGGAGTPEITVPSAYAFDKTFYLEPKTPGQKICLAIDNSSSYSYQWKTSATRMQITIVVAGDICFGDNTFYQDANTDAVVFIAIKDQYGNGGNIYYGDRRFGTVEKNNCYMYAEKDIFVTNTNSTNSKLILNGNMAAGGIVDFSMLDNGAAHHKLQIDYDARLGATFDGTASSAQRLDGIINNIPSPSSSSAAPFQISFWRQVSPMAAAMSRGYQP